MLDLVNRGIKILFSVMMGAVLVLLLFFDNTEYMCRKEFLLPNIVLISGILACFIIFMFAVYAFKRHSFGFSLPVKAMPSGNVPIGKIVNLCAVLLFVFQVYVVYNIYFRVGWDANVVFKAAGKIAYGHSDRLGNGYFSKYPNNLLIASFYALILKINRMAGIFTGNRRIIPLLIVNCAFNTMSCVLVFRTLRRLVSEKTAFAGFVLSVALFGISPWITVAYSDSVGILIPVLVLYLYIKPVSGRTKSILRYPAVILLGTAGYMIKPQTFIIIIAIILIEALYMFRSGSRREIAKKCVIFIGGILLAVLVVKCSYVIYEKEGFVLDSELKFGMTHYLKVGLNEDTNGVYSREDMENSIEYATCRERKSANINICRQRLRKMGIAGYMRHAAKKTLVNYNDGTFAWGIEGGFFKIVYREPNSGMAPFLRSIYYPMGSNHAKWAVSVQGMWLLVLSLCMCAGVGRIKDYGDAAAKDSGTNDVRKIYSVMFLAVIGLTVFELLFEARARYMYTYVPIYCVLAGCGIRVFKDKCRILLNRMADRISG